MLTKRVPSWVATTQSQINWYNEQLDYINSLPVRKINSKLMKLRDHYIREIDLLTKEVEHEYKTLSSN